MATQELKSFIEDRLRALDPSIDLESGSPAQTRLVNPLLDYLGTDPFETDIAKFLADRYRQEFPQHYAADPGAIHDTFVKPLIVFLTPFKQAIQSMRRGQSLKDPALLSDEDADDLVANVFDERDTGGYAVGVGRVLFPQASNQQVEMHQRFYTLEGLSFYPTSPLHVTAEQMLFNRQGALYYLDVPLRAEKPGADYNIAAGALVGVEGLFGAAKVTNPRRFRDGAPRMDTPALVMAARESLTERSLVNRRGGTARLRSVFKTDMRAVQVIGAGDEEMQRDYLRGSGPGERWASGLVSVSGQLALVQVDVLEGALSDVPQKGDTLTLFLSPQDYPTLLHSSRQVRLPIEEVLVVMDDLDPQASGFLRHFLVRFSGSLPAGVPTNTTHAGGLVRRGTLHITSLTADPSGLTVPDGGVHVFGHTDYYVRPVRQDVSKASLNALSDEKSLLEGVDLQLTSGSNTVGGYPFASLGALPGDTLLVETGPAAGSYPVAEVEADALVLPMRLGVNGTARFRLVRQVRLNPFEPRILKLPFGTSPANDLALSIGSKVFELTGPGSDLLTHNVKTGDVVRVLDGPDPGDFTIQRFLSGGKRFEVDRPARASGSGQRYEVFTPLEKVQRPLVRIRELLLLDANKQTTGITVPPAEAVAVRPVGPLTGARVRGKSRLKSGYVVPDLTDLIPQENLAQPGGGLYSSGQVQSEGVYRHVELGDSHDFEFDFPAEAWGRCSFFVLTAESDTDSVNIPPLQPREGEALTLKSGPNKGSYLIKRVIPQKHWIADGSKTVWTYLVQVHGTFPTDVLQQLFRFLMDSPVGAAHPDVVTGSEVISWPATFSTFLSGLGAQLHEALQGYGADSPGAETLQLAVESLVACEYEVGPAARGTLRTYFREPLLFEQRTAEVLAPTRFLFKSAAGEVLAFRDEPGRYPKQEVVPARLTGDASVLDYPRDLTQGSGSNAGWSVFSSPTLPTLFVSGVRGGDVLSVHEEVFLAGGTKAPQLIVQTSLGSNLVRLPDCVPDTFTPAMRGHLLFLEEGVDKGGYTVTEVVDGKTLALSEVMSESTPAIRASGSATALAYDGTHNLVTVAAGPDMAAHVGRYLTLFGVSPWQGSYAVLSGTSGTSVRVERTNGDFPASLALSGAYWCVSDAPLRPPLAVPGAGTVTLAGRPVRLYESTPSDYPISAVERSESLSRVQTVGVPRDGERQPYRVWRKDVRRVTPEEMGANREGALCYFDTEVVSLSPSEAANLEADSYLELEEGSYRSEGWRHVVADPSFTYSMQETGWLEVPARLLPVGSADTPDNYLQLLGAPLQVTYESAPLVEQVQDFLSSPMDRVSSANMLARHFLPAYISYDAQYVGGSAPGVIAKDILSYVDGLSVEEPLDVSKMQECITRRGGNPKTPTRAVSLLHDWKRRVWAEFSENALGGRTTRVPYAGTPRVSFFTPGPDLSGVEEEQAGAERIKLERL